MNRSEHTPGPWKWWTSNSWRRLTCDGLGRSNQDGGVLCPVTQRPDGHPDVIVSEADMGLIAAAPDMLAALKAVEEWWLSEGMSHHTGAPYAIFATRAAIVKAQTPVSR